MSQLAILKAVRDRLRDTVLNGGLAYTAAECEVCFDGQPPPICGERYVAVHPGTWRTVDIEGLSEKYGVQVTVTIRASKVPRDRLGTNLLVGPTGESLDFELERIRAKLHMDQGPRSSVDDEVYPVLTTANATITASYNGFVEPLRFRDGGKPEPRFGKWFGEEDDPSICGISQTLIFDSAARYQTVGSQT